MGFIERILGHGPKSRRIAEQDKTILELRTDLSSSGGTVASQAVELAGLKSELSRRQIEGEQFKLTIASLTQQLDAAIDKNESVTALEDRLKSTTDAMGEIQVKLDLALEEQARQFSVPLSEKDKQIAVLKAEVAAKENEICLLQDALESERKEHHKQKKATSSMWKFIHIRHRLDQPRAENTIRAKLFEAEKQ